MKTIVTSTAIEHNTHSPHYSSLVRSLSQLADCNNSNPQAVAATIDTYSRAPTPTCTNASQLDLAFSSPLWTLAAPH